MEITILFRDLQTHGVRYERFLNEAREAGVKFVQYTLEQPPVINGDKIRIFDNFLERELEIEAEIVVLSTPLIPRPDTKELSKLLRVPVSETGFLLEAHAQLRPVEFATDGVYICGAALWPADITESIFQAQAAASKASIPMQQGTVRVEPVTCTVEPHLCRACGLCVSICDYHAPEIVDDPSGRKTAVINEAICKGCGTCAAMCPTNAITARQFTDKQLMSMMETALMDWQTPVAKE
jgi:heterodisulfide reductase subunit A